MEIDLDHSIEDLLNYIESNDYAGYDPYDGLQSPLFKLPVLKSNKKIRFISQQLVKRSPINLRKLLRIKPGENPVTLGLCIQSYCYLIQSYPEKSADYLLKIDRLIDRLETLKSTPYSGACWGYEFDWEARYATIPAFTPTVVATGIISNALFECWKLTKNERCAALVISSAKFVLQDLNRHYEGSNFCFSYSPLDDQKVLNASMKGARILAQSYSIQKDSELLDLALCALNFVISHQQEDGSFSYSDKRSQIDNYHTGYILDCFDSCRENLNLRELDNVIQNGLSYYTEHFFTSSGLPKFYNNSSFPLDCTSSGQSLLTLTRFNQVDRAERVAKKTIETMQDPKGFFYFRKHSNRLIKTSFMRWSNAWMLVGLSYLKMKGQR